MQLPEMSCHQAFEFFSFELPSCVLELQEVAFVTAHTIRSKAPCYVQSAEGLVEIVIRAAWLGHCTGGLRQKRRTLEGGPGCRTCTPAKDGSSSSQQTTGKPDPADLLELDRQET